MEKIKFFVTFLSLCVLAAPLNGWAEVKKPRPFYEYKGDYRKEINDLKKRFSNNYGYELLDLDVNWRPREIEIMLKAFAQLGPRFYRLEGLKGFYRTGEIDSKAGISPEEIPAAAFPAYSTIYRGQEKRYNLYVENDFFRLEFYNALFGMDEPQAINVIHHEMAHALDIGKGFFSVSEEWLNVSGF